MDPKYDRIKFTYGLKKIPMVEEIKEHGNNIKNVSAGIFIEDEHVLLARRAQGEKLAGYWEFPGGKQHENESIYECLEREIYEELQVHCEAKKIYAESIYHYQGGAINLIAIIGKLNSNNIELHVHDRHEWVNVESLLDYNLAPADIPIARKLANQYEKN
jgi:8-oxo-dGTP diphosphatase